MLRRWLLGAGASAALLITSVPVPAEAAAPAGTSTTAGTGATPAGVANRLFHAWLRHDRRAAAGVATPSAVESVFSYAFRAPDRFAGCTGNACRFEHTSVRVPGGLGGLLMIVSGTRVTRVYQSRHETRPATVAKLLFAAWRKSDRNLGLEVATKPVVTKLFRTRYTPGSVTYFFQGCTKEAQGYSCAYSYDGGAMFMHVKGSATRGYDVRSIGYLAD
jgi:hypothetical protein